ncbi:MAG: outer membrane protein assembly factor BamE [Bryobacteraceae bacterium]|nr:outer membrane protein assembly factor BamE [Bryobacteraceae bacterium]
MTARFRLRQAWIIARLEVRRLFLSRRGLWVYGLAMLPAALFLIHGIDVQYRLGQSRRGGIVQPAVVEALQTGMTEQQVIEMAGKPQEDRQWTRRKWEERVEGGRKISEQRVAPARRMIYFDGSRRVLLFFEDGLLRDINKYQILNFPEDREVFAAIFQYYYLRLAVFFGCLGVFLNLFRGEMMDKTLHFWLLAPARRGVLLAGKFLAGWMAATAIFAGGALLAFAAMLWPHMGAEGQAYWQGPGPMHAFRYALAAAAGCAGYGSLFLAASLWVRNPIIPAAVLLVWEAARSFLPSLLQKLTVLYYLESLCPVPAPLDPEMPALLRLLLAPAEPLDPWLASAGIVLFSAVVLRAAVAGVRRLQINYSTD